VSFQDNAGRALILASAVAVGVATAASADEIPRTSSGKPDFSGNYDISTLTPIERSPELGERLHLTEEEAERIRSREAARVDLTALASDPDRDAPAAGASAGRASTGSSCRTRARRGGATARPAPTTTRSRCRSQTAASSR